MSLRVSLRPYTLVFALFLTVLVISRILPSTQRCRNFDRSDSSSHRYHVSFTSYFLTLSSSSLIYVLSRSCQTNELGSEYRKNSGPFVSIAPVYTSGQPGRSPTGASESGSNASNNSTSAFQSTFKTLAHPSAISDNVFDELETRRPTSWQFELHQRMFPSTSLSSRRV